MPEEGEDRGAAGGGWELGGALRGALGGLPLSSGPAQDEHLARLRPLLEGELGNLGRRGGLSREERATQVALRALLDASKAAEDRAARAGVDVPPGTREPR